MRTKQLFFLTFLLVQLCFTQNTKLIDSLKRELKNKKQNDTTKLVILTGLHENLMFSEPEEAKQYALQELELYKRTGYEFAYALGNLHIGDYYYNKTKNDSAKHYYNLAKNSFLKINKPRGLVFVNFTLGEILKTEGKYKKAINIFVESIDAINDYIKEPYYIKQFKGSSYLAIGNCYLDKGDLNLALSNSLKAKDLFEKINDGPRFGDALSQIGKIEKELGHLQLSLNYYQKALKFYIESNDNIYITYTTNHIGEIYKDLGEIDKAKQNLLKAIELAEIHKINSTLSEALDNLGNIYIEKKQYNSAKKYLTKSQEITKREQISQGIINTYQSLSKLNLHENQYREAVINIDSAINLAIRTGAILKLDKMYKSKSTILSSLGNYKESIYFLKKSNKLKDSLFSLKKIQQIEELKTIYETEKKEAQITLQNEEIKTLNAQAKNDRLTKTLYGIGMFSFLAITGLLYFVFKQRIKKNNIEREKQEAIYKQEIAFKKKELTSQTLHLVQKNAFIQELKDNLEKIKESPELFKVEFRRLVMLLKKESAEDKDWEVFKSYFSEVHNNFDHKIKEIAEDISEKEIRLASFLRMNLSTKEIASMLNVLPDSVLKSKYRLKKKLNLDKETDLNTFLSDL